MIKKIFGIAPTKEKNGSAYIPSPMGRMLGVDKVSGFKASTFEGKKYRGDKKILVLCTEERYFEMANGKQFSTGNNVQETMVPIMHLVNGGFDFEVVTPTGKKAILEEWSVPLKDEAVIKFRTENQLKFNNPLSLKKLIENDELNDTSKYIALFLPGGHGAMVGLPEDENVGKLLRWIKTSDRYLVAVCHGPAAMIAKDKKDEPNPYKGYKMVAFPDKFDKQSPSLGYLPGQLPWFQCEALEKEGIEVINDKITGATHIDRKLISGDSPKACDELGKITVDTLFKELEVN
ncbi:DJ-1/PfpI family protein [Marivirga arenosa]|uniref:DJ-1/PfpI family protein n=1 Tax=Marivirga arenosa TaxID=3059076 RepID=A0AA51ZVQ2_9BACT|nr:DJ-1/PfpI family protein [Marivirga sp. BKB1-2]WNB17611.1 DJ-1/PfpI family protein [Marivirga sp. BKB1-2]